MKRTTLTTPSFTALLLISALVSIFGSPPAQATDESQAVEMDTTVDRGVVVRYAVLLGTVDSEAPPPKSAHQTVDALLTWDFDRDNDELMKLLGLRAIHTLQHSSVQLDRDQGEVGISTTAGEKKIDVEMRLEVFRPESPDQGLDEAPNDASNDAGQAPYATLWFQVKSAGELLSAPTVSNRLGQRAIVSTLADDKSWIIFLVVEVDDADS